MTEKENMVAGRPFLGSDPELMEDKKKARIFCEELNRSPGQGPFRENGEAPAHQAAVPLRLWIPDIRG